MINDELARRSHFAEHWMAWIALRHFLPAQLQWELAQAAASSLVSDDIRIESLYERHQVDPESVLGGWVVFPRNPRNPEYSQIFNIVRAMAWQSDHGPVHVDNSSTSPAEAIKRAFSRAWELGTLDLNAQPATIDRCQVKEQASAQALWHALRFACSLTPSEEDSKACVEKLLESLAGVPAPLRQVAIKHLGDLFGAEDHWAIAEAAYGQAVKELPFTSEWSALQQTFGASLTQSIAITTQLLIGPAHASSHLATAIGDATRPDHLLLSINGRLDQLNYQTAASPEDAFSVWDQRPSLLIAPQIYSAMDLETPLKHVLEEKSVYTVVGQFWRVLRRQLALGLHTLAKDTQAHFGFYLLRLMTQGKEHSLDADDFELGVNLLLQGGNHQLVDKMTWTDTLVGRYVTESLVQVTINSAERHPGDSLRRSKVTIQLFSSWLAARRSTDQAVDTMMKYLLKCARRSGSFYSSQDVAGQTMTELLKVFRKQPQLKGEYAEDLVSVVAKHLQAERSHWSTYKEAMNLSLGIFEELPQPAADALVRVILDFLHRQSPTANNWLVVRPALRILTSETNKERVRSDAVLSKEILDQLIRFGTEQETENANLLFYLHNYDAKLLEDPLIAERISSTVLSVRNDLERLSSSSTDGNITALLLAPTLAGQDGLNQALGAIKAVLDTANSKRISIALPYVYSSVLALSNRRAEISAVFSGKEEQFNDHVRAIYEGIRSLWSAAHLSPKVFMEFAIPEPSEPNPVIVYNWTIATLRFCQIFEDVAGIQALRGELDLASKNANFGDSVVLARSEFRASDVFQGDEVEIRFATPEAFYRSLSSRILIGRRTDPNRAISYFQELALQCLEFGPHQLDTIAFLSAADRGVQLSKDDRALSLYRSKLSNSHDLARAINPILSLLIPR